jgi:competence protein ComEA
MKGWELFTPAERRLAVLLFALAALGQMARVGGHLSPEVSRWLEGDPSPRTLPDTALAAESLTVQVAPAPPDTLASSAPPAEPTASIDPNTADLTTLMRLPGVGPVLAHRILEERAHGRYARPEDLLRVPGIGPAKLAKLRPHLRIGENRAAEVSRPGPRG